MKRSYLLSSALFLALSHSALAQVDVTIDEPWDPGMSQQAPQGQVALPMTYTGEGLTVVIDRIDQRTMSLSGSLSQNGGPRQPMSVRVQTDSWGNQVGVGQVQTRQGVRPIQIRDESDTVAQIQFEGRQYRVQSIGAQGGGSQAGGQAISLTYSGDGMRVVLQGVDENTGLVSGTISLGQGPAMPFNLRLQADAQGNMIGYGSLQTPQGTQQFQSRDISENSTQVNLGGRTYTVTDESTARAQTPSPYPDSATPSLYPPAPSFGNNGGFDSEFDRTPVERQRTGRDNTYPPVQHGTNGSGFGGRR